MTVYHVMGSPPENDSEQVFLSPAFRSRIDAERVLEECSEEWEGWFLWIEEDEERNWQSATAS